MEIMTGTNRAITGANRDVKRDRLREIYFGAKPEISLSTTPVTTPVMESVTIPTTSSNITGVKPYVAPTEEDVVVNNLDKNYYGWQLTHVTGLEESIELKNYIMDQEVIVVVYKEKNETGLVPHLDVEFRTPNTHLDIIQLAQLVEVIKDAKKMLND